MSEIRRLDKSSESSSIQKPRIIGANEIGNSDPVILDKTTKQEEQPVQVRVHEETVTDEDRLRRQNFSPSDTRVRLRSSNRKKWERVKRLEDESS